MRAFVIASLIAVARSEASLPLGYNGYALNGAILGYNGGYALGAPLAAAPAVAAPAAVTAVLKTAAPAIPSITSSQYRAGDELGNTAFGYSNINSARQEKGNAAGVTGSYSYNGPAGPVAISYVADALGFRVVNRRRRSIAALPAAAAYGYGLPAVTYGANLALPAAATYGAAAIPTVSAGYTALDSALSLPAAPLNAGLPTTTYAATTIAAAAPLAATYAAAPAIAAAPLAATYAAAPLAATYAAAPAITAAPLAASYAAAPAIAAAPLAAAPAIAAAPLAATYAAAPAQREAILTTIKLNPGHATAYRVD